MERKELTGQLLTLYEDLQYLTTKVDLTKDLIDDGDSDVLNDFEKSRLQDLVGSIEAKAPGFLALMATLKSL